MKRKRGADIESDSLHSISRALKDTFAMRGAYLIIRTTNFLPRTLQLKFMRKQACYQAAVSRMTIASDYIIMSI